MKSHYYPIINHDIPIIYQRVEHTFPYISYIFPI